MEHLFNPVFVFGVPFSTKLREEWQNRDLAAFLSRRDDALQPLLLLIELAPVDVP
jgi:hypothetical protein